jgi:mRNA interferase RelE/StbE
MKYLEDNPRNGPNIKTMQGFSNRYRYRIGDFRVVYEVMDKELIVWVLETDWRGNIY